MLANDSGLSQARDANCGQSSANCEPPDEAGSRPRALTVQPCVCCTSGKGSLQLLETGLMKGPKQIIFILEAHVLVIECYTLEARALRPEAKGWRQSSRPFLPVPPWRPRTAQLCHHLLVYGSELSIGHASGHVEFLETCFLRTDLPNGLPASPLSAPAADQMNPSTWHHLVPCGGRPKPDGTPCVVFMVCFHGYFGRGRLSLPSVRLQPLFFPAPLSPGAGPAGSHTRCYFCYSSVCAFHLFPGRAFLKLLELVAFACICEVCAICLAPCFQFRFTCR